MSIADLSTTAGSNTAINGQSIQGSANANTIDSMFQATAALLAQFYDDIGGTGTVGGTADAITLTTGSGFGSLATGLVAAFKAGGTNTGATTINVDTLGIKKVRRQGDSALSAGDIVDDGVYLIRYDAAYDGAAGAWVLLNPSVAALPGFSALADPGADRILFWDDSAGKFDWLTASTGLTITTTSMTSSSGGLTLVGTLTTTSGTEQIITDIPTTYKYLMAVVRGLSFASTNTLVLGVSQNNGSSYDIQADVSTALSSAGDVMAGTIMIFNTSLTSTAKYIVSNVKCTGSSATAALGIQSGATGKTTALRFRGGTFDAGAIDIYGVD